MSTRLPDTTARREPPGLAGLLREPFLATNEHIQRRLAEHGHPEIRVAHGNVFQFLDDAGTRVSVLAERAQMTKQSMAELVAHLESHGYVERVPDPADGRAKLVRTTRAGRDVFPVARAAMAELEDRWTRQLGARRMRELRRLLAALNAADAPAAAAFDFAGFRTALEARDVARWLPFYADDAEWVEYRRADPPRAPHVMRGREEIGAFLEEVAASEIELAISNELVGAARAAFTITVTRTRERLIVENVILDHRDGRIVRQHEVEAWD
jgi:DNA-binding MarR family transcriptional regulator